MTNTERWLYFLMEGQAVERFHSRPLLKPITDAQHQHGVAMLCWRLTEGMCSLNLILAALTHDMAEQAAGDVPAPTKWKLGILSSLASYEKEVLKQYGVKIELEPAEERVLKLADAMEGMLSCCRERFLGNKYVALAYGKWLKVMMQEALSGPAMEVLNGIEHIWNIASKDGDPLFDVFAEVTHVS